MSRITKSSTMLALLLAGGLLGSASQAATLTVQVQDRSGNSVPEVAVFVERTGIAPNVGGATEPAVMDQRNTQFDPHMLVVQKGSSVIFPNSDVIAHHVYSFSKPNSFVLPIYKGETPDPVAFDVDGIVTLGCNIHDQMLAYIVVVDTDLIGVTDESGIVTLEVGDSAAGYDVSIWSARIKDSKGPIVQHLESTSGGAALFALQKKLRPAPDNQSEAVQWSEY